MSRSPLDSDLSFVGHLIRTGHGEEALTEFLAGLLRDPGIRHAFVKDVLGLALPPMVIDAATVRSEPEDATEKGIPDLEIRSGNDLFILVENKLGARFTDNQPHEYFASLQRWRLQHPRGAACLVIQAPVQRLPFLQEEAWKILTTSFPTAQRSGSALADVSVLFVSWERTRAILKSVQVPNPIVQYLCESFLQLLPVEIESVSRVITKEYQMQLSDITTLEALAALEDLLRDVRCRMSETYVIKPSSDNVEFTYQGFDATPKDSGDRGTGVWVGVSAHFAARFNVNPLLMQLWGDNLGSCNALNKSGLVVIPRDQVVAFGWMDSPVVCLTIHPDLHPEKQAEEVVRQIESIRMALSDQGADGE